MSTYYVPIVWYEVSGRAELIGMAHNTEEAAEVEMTGIVAYIERLHELDPKNIEWYGSKEIRRIGTTEDPEEAARHWLERAANLGQD